MKELEVEMFFSSEIHDLQRQINEFLVNLPSNTVKDIKFTQSEDSQNMHFSVMVIYEVDTCRFK